MEDGDDLEAVKQRLLPPALAAELRRLRAELAGEAAGPAEEAAQEPPQASGYLPTMEVRVGGARERLPAGCLLGRNRARLLAGVPPAGARAGQQGLLVTSPLPSPYPRPPQGIKRRLGTVSRALRSVSPRGRAASMPAVRRGWRASLLGAMRRRAAGGGSGTPPIPLPALQRCSATAAPCPRSAHRRTKTWRRRPTPAD